MSESETNDERLKVKGEREMRENSFKMSSDEEESEFSASDEEGDEKIIQIIDDESDQSQNEYEDGSEEEDGKIRKQLEELVWTNKLPASKGKKRKKKDRCPRSKLVNGFEPSTVMDCFNRFMTSTIKELILKYTNLKGEESIFLPSFSLSLFLIEN